MFGEYSDTDVFATMQSNQLEKFASYDGKMETDPAIPCNLFLLSWTLTSPVGGGVSALSYVANLNLVSNMQTLNPNSGGFTPNILYVDYYERSRVTDTAIAMTNRFSQLDAAGEGQEAGQGRGQRWGRWDNRWDRDGKWGWESGQTKGSLFSWSHQ